MDNDEDKKGDGDEDEDLKGKMHLGLQKELGTQTKASVIMDPECDSCSCLINAAQSG